MPSPSLPNNAYRYIQVEETTEKYSFSESVLQAIGGDLNFIKAQLDTAFADIADFQAAGGLSAQQIFIAEGTGQTFQSSPNGKNIMFAAMTPNFNGNAQAQVTAVIPGNQLTYFTFSPGPESPGGFTMQAKIQANTLFVANFGHEWYGYFLYET